MILRDIATKLIIFNEENAQLFLGNYDDFLEKTGWDDEPKAKKKEENEKKIDVPDIIPTRQKFQKKRERGFA